MDPVTRRVPLDKRKRTETSCDKCKFRKQKCDKAPGQLQCRYCELRGIECSITQPRKKRIYGSVEGVGNRLALLESLVKGLLPEADLSSNDEMRQLGKSLGIPLPLGEEERAARSAGEMMEDSRRDEGRKGDVEEEAALPLLPDQQGQVQYIGPASSFSFHLKLRRLMGNYSSFEFAMFGKNAAEENSAVGMLSVGEGHVMEDERRPSYALSDCNSPSDAVREIDGLVLDSLIDSYFDVVHSDFPVLHEASFREAYEIWSASDATSAANPVWLCGLLCVLILARRVAPIAIPQEAEQKWWRHVQTLLPTVFFASNVFTVQALMLAALHLHNTNHRDACWNLTGTAIRIAFAIGLHRDDVKHVQSPLGRELRKQLWWTLYAFEQIQVSSYDRPTAIEHTLASVGCPNERIVGVAGNCPQDYMKCSQSLVVLLGSACRALHLAGVGIAATEDAYSKPLSPAASILRDLAKWKEELPSHLRLQIIDSLAPSSQRPVILLHAQFHYTMILMSRSSLLRRATVLSKNGTEALPASLLSISETCIESGRSLGRLLRKLETIEKFNPFTWWDIFYTVCATLILILDISCSITQGTPNKSKESKNIIKELSNLMQKYLSHPRLPGSMRKWATIVVDVGSMAEQMLASDQVNSGNKTNVMIDSQLQELATSAASSTSTANRVAGFPGSSWDIAKAWTSPSPSVAVPYDVLPHSRDGAQQFWSQVSFMDDSSGQAHDWSWDDIDSILRGGSGSQQATPDRRRL